MSDHNDELRKALDKFYQEQTEAHVAGAGPRPGDSICAWKKPIVSNTIGVHPSQIKQAREDARKHGVCIEFNEKGQAIFESRGQRKEYCEKLKGAGDMDGGYSDPQFKGVKYS